MAQWCGACERLSGRLGVCVESIEQKGLLLLLSLLLPSLLFVINKLILLMILFISLCVFACTNVGSMGGHQIS